MVNTYEALIVVTSRSCGLTPRSAVVRLLKSWGRFRPWESMLVCYECCMLSGTGLCDGLITRPEEPYRLCLVVVCDLEASKMRRPWPALGCSAVGKEKAVMNERRTP